MFLTHKITNLHIHTHTYHQLPSRTHPPGPPLQSWEEEQEREREREREEKEKEIEKEKEKEKEKGEERDDGIAGKILSKIGLSSPRSEGFISLSLSLSHIHALTRTHTPLFQDDWPAESSLSSWETVLPDEIELGETIGKGQYGQVFKAKWRGDIVAVKQLLPVSAHTATASRVKGCFLREMHTLASLRSPYLVSLSLPLSLSLSQP